MTLISLDVHYFDLRAQGVTRNHRVRAHICTHLLAVNFRRGTISEAVLYHRSRSVRPFTPLVSCHGLMRDLHFPVAAGRAFKPSRRMAIPLRFRYIATIETCLGTRACSTCRGPVGGEGLPYMGLQGRGPGGRGRGRGPGGRAHGRGGKVNPFTVTVARAMGAVEGR